MCPLYFFFKIISWGAWLAKWVEHATQSQGCEFESHAGCKDDLKIFFLQSIALRNVVKTNVLRVASFLDQICLLYNKGEALYGYCNLKDKCNKFHVCKSFVRGECRLQKCKRSHQLIHATALQLLQDQGLNIPSVVNFQIISTYKHMKLHKMLESQGETIRGRQSTSSCFDLESQSRGWQLMLCPWGSRTNIL